MRIYSRSRELAIQQARERKNLQRQLRRKDRKRRVAVVLLLVAFVALVVLSGCATTPYSELQSNAIACDKELGVPEIRKERKQCETIIGMTEEKCKKQYPINNDVCWEEAWKRQDAITRREKQKAEWDMGGRMNCVTGYPVCSVTMGKITGCRCLSDTHY